MSPKRIVKMFLEELLFRFFCLLEWYSNLYDDNPGLAFLISFVFIILLNIAVALWGYK